MNSMNSSRQYFDSRSAYALTAFLCSLPFTIWLGLLYVSDPGSDGTLTGTFEVATLWRWLAMLMGGSAVPTLSAWWLWRDGNRSNRAMMGRGLAVVLFTTLLGPWFPILTELAVDTRHSAIGVAAHTEQMIRQWLVAMLFGNVFTLGLPWVMGLGASAAFAETREATS